MIPSLPTSQIPSSSSFPPTPLCPSHTTFPLLMQMYQACLLFRCFALAVPSASNTFPPDPQMPATFSLLRSWLKHHALRDFPGHTFVLISTTPFLLHSLSLRLFYILHHLELSCCFVCLFIASCSLAYHPHWGNQIQENIVYTQHRAWHRVGGQ